MAVTRSCRDAQSALAALLDALEADLLGAPSQDLRAAFREAGLAPESAVRDLRALLRDAAEAKDQDRYLPTLPCDGRGSIGTRLN